MSYCVCSQEDNSYQKLLDTYNQVIKVYPADSLSLHRLYFEWVKDRDKLTNLRQIDRLKNLISNESVMKYRNIENNLKPVLENIVYNNLINKSNAIKFNKLYSDYDYFSGEGLLTNILDDKDNYDLVWKSFEKLAEAATNDTLYTTVLISLDNSIRTNVELAETTRSFVLRAIKNNPEGFLLMYSSRDETKKKQLLEYIVFDQSPDIELLDVFKKIAKNTKNESLSKISIELIDAVNNKIY